MLSNINFRIAFYVIQKNLKALDSKAIAQLEDRNGMTCSSICWLLYLLISSFQKIVQWKKKLKQCINLLCFQLLLSCSISRPMQFAKEVTFLKHFQQWI